MHSLLHEPFRSGHRSPVFVAVEIRRKNFTPIVPALWLTMFVWLLLAGPVQAEEPIVLPIWPGAVPGDFGSIGPERVRAPSERPKIKAKLITNVTKPTITFFRPARDKNTGTAMVICPGGGYWDLFWDVEGEEVAAWLNTVGITGIVLKYRVPRRPGQPEPLPAPGPLLDAQRAVSLVRSRAVEWGIDSNRIGIVGFSAGGHLAVATATHFDQRAYEPIDEIDKVSCRPNFAVAVYPGYLIAQHPAGVETNKNTLAPYIRIPAETPPVFLVHASDDAVAGSENSVVMYQSLKRAGVSAELHVYARGGHGFGARKSNLPSSTWTDRCVAWLAGSGLLGSSNLAGSPDGLEPLPEGDQGIAARHPGDKGIESNPAVLFHDDFETGDPWSKWDNIFHRANTRLAEEPDNAHGGRRALEFKVPKQQAEVSNEAIKRFKEGHDRVFLRYYSKFEKGFDQTGSSHNGGFLAAIAPGLPFATPGVRADGRNKFIVSFECWRSDVKTPAPGEINVYCYHPEQRDAFGDHFFPSGKVSPFTYRPGPFGPHFVGRPDLSPILDRWYCYEVMLKANTVGERDGRVACWLDGKLIADFPNLRLRDVDTLKINFAALDLHIKSNTTRENKKWYDDVVVATSYVGPITRAP